MNTEYGQRNCARTVVKCASGVHNLPEVHVFVSFFFDDCDDVACVPLAKMVSSVVFFIDQIPFHIEKALHVGVFQMLFGERSHVHNGSLKHPTRGVHAQFERSVRQLFDHCGGAPKT